MEKLGDWKIPSGLIVFAALLFFSTRLNGSISSDKAIIHLIGYAAGVSLSIFGFAYVIRIIFNKKKVTSNYNILVGIVSLAAFFPLMVPGVYELFSEGSRLGYFPVIFLLQIAGSGFCVFLLVKYLKITYRISFFTVLLSVFVLFISVAMFMGIEI